MHASNHAQHIAKEQFQQLTGQFILAVPFIAALAIYLIAVLVSNRQQKTWPLYRTFLWVAGIIGALAAVIGPLASRGHMDFTAHMIGHLLLGMLSPLLMVLAAPMTLLLRTLSVASARRLSHVLKSRYVRIISNPAVATVLNVGGLWVLYTTDLYSAMHENVLLHVIIHLHVFLAGYLFTASMIYIDPTPHRTSYYYRTVVFIIALAAHGVLSKNIYANPPNGVPADQAESGGMLMYYGGDAIDIVLIIVLFYQWYKATRPRMLAQHRSLH